MAETEPFVVVAIDFGTTYSGYAFSFRHDFKQDPTKCSYIKWDSGIGGFQHDKTSTCVLFDDNGNFHSFGFEAEEKYANLAIDNAHRKWFFFRRFKMCLYDKTSAIKRNFTLKADNGKHMEAMVVFSSAIRYLKDQLVEELEKQHPSAISVNDMLFVLTVPAIWTYQAKQFMREAAEKAGINKQRLRLALEPEVASLYCKHLPKLDDECFIKPGTRYIILDAGGGTVDITVHEVENGGTLKEICKANGGDWGGTSIDNKFRKLLISIVGENVWALFEQEHKYNMLEIFTSFEIKKRTIKPGITDRVTFKAPVSLVQLFKKLNNGKELDERVKEDGDYLGSETKSE